MASEIYVDAFGMTEGQTNFLEKKSDGSSFPTINFLFSENSDFVEIKSEFIPGYKRVLIQREDFLILAQAAIAQDNAKNGTR